MSKQAKKYVLPTLAYLMIFAGLAKAIGYMVIVLIVVTIGYLLWKALS